MAKSNTLNNLLHNASFGSSPDGHDSAPTPLPGLADAPTELTSEGAFEKHWLHTLAHVLTEEIHELHSAEKLLLETLPQMTLAVEDPNLRAICQIHAENTREHLRRLEKVESILHLHFDGRACEKMEVLLQGLRENINENRPGMNRDLGLVDAVSKIKQFELAGYCSARDFAQLLGMGAVMNILQSTLDEETALVQRFDKIHDMLCIHLGSREYLL
ncbi:MAG TPA: DUF892 family protein [Opitutales bacterium]|jgi:ferritin-like metal-binding protein YciE|nr:DUF892 family protein [Opitutales bacterium]